MNLNWLKGVNRRKKSDYVYVCVCVCPPVCLLVIETIAV